MAGGLRKAVARTGRPVSIARAVAGCLVLVALGNIGFAYSRNLKSGWRVPVPSSGKVTLRPGGYVLYEDLEDIDFPVSPSGVTVIGDEGKVSATPYGFSPGEVIPSMGKSIYLGVAAIAVDRPGQYSVEVTFPTLNNVILARSPSSVARANLGWFLMLALGLLLAAGARRLVGRGTALRRVGRHFLSR